jgi:hypothetical protein
MVNGVHIPKTSQRRPEFGEIFDIGTPLDEEQRIIATELHELKKQGIKIPISYGSGVGYWTDNDRQAGLDEKEWGWLKEYRVYRIGELAGYLWEDVN